MRNAVNLVSYMKLFAGFLLSNDSWKNVRLGRSISKGRFHSLRSKKILYEQSDIEDPKLDVQVG